MNPFFVNNLLCFPNLFTFSGEWFWNLALQRGIGFVKGVLFLPTANSSARINICLHLTLPRFCANSFPSGAALQCALGHYRLPLVWPVFYGCFMPGLIRCDMQQTERPDKHLTDRTGWSSCHTQSENWNPSQWGTERWYFFLLTIRCVNIPTELGKNFGKTSSGCPWRAKPVWHAFVSDQNLKDKFFRLLVTVFSKQSAALELKRNTARNFYGKVQMHTWS